LQKFLPVISILHPSPEFVALPAQRQQQIPSLRTQSNVVFVPTLVKDTEKVWWSPGVATGWKILITD
jgi:hypothetical protein